MMLIKSIVFRCIYGMLGAFLVVHGLPLAIIGWVGYKLGIDIAGSLAIPLAIGIYCLDVAINGES